jgi:hypothetical protein
MALSQGREKELFFWSSIAAAEKTDITLKLTNLDIIKFLPYEKIRKTSVGDLRLKLPEIGLQSLFIP